MKHKTFLTAVAILSCVISACDAPKSTEPHSGDSPDPEDAYVRDLNIPIQFENLQVLPKNITRKDPIRNMRVMSRSLGVRCEHCHDMRIENYASDNMEAKRVARDMLRLVDTLNSDLFIRKDVPPETCFMCHRHELKPPMEMPSASAVHLEHSVIIPKSDVGAPAPH